LNKRTKKLKAYWEESEKRGGECTNPDFFCGEGARGGFLFNQTEKGKSKKEKVGRKIRKTKTRCGQGKNRGERTLPRGGSY